MIEQAFTKNTLTDHAFRSEQNHFHLTAFRFHERAYQSAAIIGCIIADFDAEHKGGSER